MKNHLFVTFLIVTVYWQSGQTAKVKGVINRNTKKDAREEKISRNHFPDIEDNIFPKINIRGVTIDIIDREKSAAHREVLNTKTKLDLDNNNNNRGIFERNGYIFDYDAGNPDIYGEMKRPCQVYDTFCIRKFFAEHSHCKISGRAVPDPLYRAEGTVNLPSTNISGTQVNADYGGLNDARISEFYINKVTDNLVIAITFNNATKFSNNTYFIFYLRGREPIVTRDFGGIQYGVLTVTVVIPQLKNLRLDKAEIYTYGDTDIYPLVLGPGIGQSTDPEVTSMYAQFYSNIPTEYQEEISNQGNFMAANYIQYNICDFGLKVL